MQAVLSGKVSRIAAAVSGGADSMALALCLADWCNDHNVDLFALTVDHGLRAEAADEARQVGVWLKNIPHEILHWQGEKPQASLQEEARMARYRLMGSWCAERSITHLFLAHHQDDQAETFLMRLFRGSGVEGLSAMSREAAFPVTCPGHDCLPRLCRPLLSIPKARLVATLEEKDQNWIEDPSNRNESFMRVRVRNLLETSNIEGFDAGRLAGTADRMQRVRSLLHDLEGELEASCVTFHAQGYATLGLSSFRRAHSEIALRLLSGLLKGMSGGIYGPRFQKLESLYKDLLGEDFSGRTLGGCKITPLSEEQVGIFRESDAISDEFDLALGEARLWDNRFWIQSKGPGRIIRLGPQEWKMVDPAQAASLKLWANFGHFKLGLPCLKQPDGRVILPSFQDPSAHSTRPDIGEEFLHVLFQGFRNSSKFNGNA